MAEVLELELGFTAVAIEIDRHNGHRRRRDSHHQAVHHYGRAVCRGPISLNGSEQSEPL